MVSRMVVGITTSVTTASRQPIAKRDQHDDGDRGEPEVEQQLVGLVVGRSAVVAGDLDRDIGRDQPALQRLDARR